MSDPNKAVFLSYASEDAAAARRICESLRAASIEVWLDQDGGIEHGDEWDAKIRRQIKECLFFLPIISANTEARHEGYFRIEWELAADRSMGFAQSVPFILPIVIDDTNELQALVPERFRRVQWTRLPGGIVSADVQTRFLKLWAARTGLLAPAPARGQTSPPFAELQAALAVMSPAANEKSLAVLPFADMSAEPGQEYFSDGITEEIINALVQVPDLQVAARTSSFSFKGKPDDLRTIASKLNVRTVLSGSVRKAGNRVRITAQLINAADGFNLWSERFDRDLDDIFAMQDEIARAIVDKLKAGLTRSREQPLVLPSTGNLDAYQLYLQGRYHWNQRGAGLGKALHLFEAALAHDPDFALAHAGLADSCTLLGFYGFVRPSNVAAKARAAAARAVALNPDLAEAQTAHAFVLFSFDRNLPPAERAFRRAIELKPSYAPARYWLASLLIGHRRYAEAVQLDEEAVRLEPHSLFANVHLAWMLLLSEHPADAVKRLHYVLELEPKFLMAHWLLGQAYISLGQAAEGLETLGRAKALSGNLPLMTAGVGCALAHLGRKAEALLVLEELVRRSRTEYVSAYVFATLHGFLGDQAAALVWLEKAYEECDASLPYMAADPDLFMCTGLPRKYLSAENRAAFIKRIGTIFE
jgi:TolB-like protein/cytochrome c-type biogenesis protein CcmH/NrfG